MYLIVNSNVWCYSLIGDDSLILLILFIQIIIFVASVTSIWLSRRLSNFLLSLLYQLNLFLLLVDNLILDKTALLIN